MTTLRATGKLSETQIQTLLKIKAQVTWLDLSTAQLSGSSLQTIGQLPHLTRLNLSHCNINDQELSALEALKNLESLQLVDTPITDQALAIIQKLPALQTVYLWQTAISDHGIENLKSQKPGLEVIQGFQFEVVE